MFRIFADATTSGIADPSAAKSTIAPYVTTAINLFVMVSGAAALVFVIYGAYLYATSRGKPDELAHAKKVIRNAFIGLALVIGAATLVAVLQGAFNTSSSSTASNLPALGAIQPAPTGLSIAGLLADGVSQLLTNLIQSAIRPLVDGVISFLVSTPLLSHNSAVFGFWLVTVAIADGLLVLVIALLGFHVMSASTLGFEELSVRQLLPRIGLAFLIANTSIFLVDGAISLCNVIVQALLHATISPAHPASQLISLGILSGIPNIFSAGTNFALIVLFLAAIFLVFIILLLLKYITRLIAIAVGAVLAPFVCLLWLLPPFRDFATNALRIYLITIFVIIVDVVIIQLSSSFLTVSGSDAVMSTLVGIGMVLMILKIPSMLSQIALFSSGGAAMRKLGGTFMNGVSHLTSREPQTVRAEEID